MGQGMDVWGWVFIAAAWGFILFFAVFCFYKVLFEKPKEEKRGKETFSAGQ
jgi:protein-S-isoprenylcysteine O-methyltransferase Ste14